MKNCYVKDSLGNQKKKKNASSMASLQNSPFGTVIFKNMTI